MVFQELAPAQAHKIKSRTDLESELFSPSNTANSLPKIRENEGEAAEHGVYFDDTEYDYMQHIRDLNTRSINAESHFVEAPTKKREAKGKGKMSLEEALRESTLQDGRSEIETSTVGSLLDESMLPSKTLIKSTYQSQQEIPDAIAGFQPDMDPRLREVLEALEDEAYVDDSEDFFEEIAKDGEEVSLKDFEDTPFPDDDDAGWESDTTEKPNHEYSHHTNTMPPPPVPSSADAAMSDAPDHGDGDWMAEFSKFKQLSKSTKLPKPDLQSSIITGTSITSNKHRKKRKGAMTSSTGYSMTSSSLLRTEGLTLLDARFDKIEEDYGEDGGMDFDDGTASVMTGSVASSQAPELVRKDFEGMMDEFLGGYSMKGKRVKKGGYQSGMEQLDEVRKGLGPARMNAGKAV